ncbi:MAG: hypothetical protein HYY93_12980 [Planctomycetes bacterium]|nr:hypothetical protein [Planctomycetota bacterium]
MSIFDLNPDSEKSPEPADGDKSVPPALLGLGLDAKDGHSRLTRGPEFVIVGGSGRTHDRMVERSMAFTSLVHKYGRRTQDLSAEEYYAIIDEMGEPRRHWLYFPRS